MNKVEMTALRAFPLAQGRNNAIRRLKAGEAFTVAATRADSLEKAGKAKRKTAPKAKAASDKGKGE